MPIYCPRPPTKGDMCGPLAQLTTKSPEGSLSHFVTSEGPCLSGSLSHRWLRVALCPVPGGDPAPRWLHLAALSHPPHLPWVSSRD